MVLAIRYKLFVAFSVVLLLAAAVAFYGIAAISQADRLVVRFFDEPFMAVSYAREAPARFNDARAGSGAWIGDSGLDRALGEIDLRVAVELAKAGIR